MSVETSSYEHPEEPHSSAKTDKPPVQTVAHASAEPSPIEQEERVESTQQAESLLDQTVAFREASEVYQNVTVSGYGPGLYGPRALTAYGEKFTPKTEGVAHRTLPYGTPIEITYKGKKFMTKVVDKGPFVPGRMFDLSEKLYRKVSGIPENEKMGLLKVGIRIFRGKTA